MKLAFCLFKYFPYGGLQRDFMRIAKTCIEHGHTVDVYTMAWDGEQDPAIPVHIIPSKGWQNHSRSQHFARQFQSHKNRYDVIIGFNKMPGLDIYYAADTCFQAKARKKHGAWYRLLPRYRHLANFEQAVFQQGAKTKILLISHAQQKEFEHYYQTESERFHLLPPGIARDRIAPDNADELRKQTRRELGLHDSDFLLLLIGSGFKTKGLDRALIAVSTLPDEIKQRTHFWIIGKDNPRPFIQQAKQLGIHHHIKYWGGRDDVPRFLMAGDLLLHPAYNENTGTVLLESIVSGLPVMATDVCGYADYIRAAQAGFVLPSPFSQTQFNQTLADMLLSSSRNILRQNGLAFAKHADIYSMPEHAVKVIESLNV